MAIVLVAPVLVAAVLAGRMTVLPLVYTTLNLYSCSHFLRDKHIYQHPAVCKINKIYKVKRLWSQDYMISSDLWLLYCLVRIFYFYVLYICYPFGRSLSFYY